jgi:hypothetical protein
VSDYYLTILFARRYKEYLHNYVNYEGSIELTPEFQKDVDELRLVSPQFIIRWLVSSILFYLLWWSTVVDLEQPQIFYILIGAFILRGAVVLLRHFRNLSIYPIAKSGGLTGKIEYTRWSVLKLSAKEFIGFSVMFLLLAILLKSWFFGGGVFGCMVTGVQHWNMSKKALAISQTSQDETPNA